MLGTAGKAVGDRGWSVGGGLAVIAVVGAADGVGEGVAVGLLSPAEAADPPAEPGEGVAVGEGGVGVAAGLPGVAVADGLCVGVFGLAGEVEFGVAEQAVSGCRPRIRGKVGRGSLRFDLTSRS